MFLYVVGWLFLKCQSRLQQTQILRHFSQFSTKIRYDSADDSHKISCLIGYFWKGGKVWNCHLLQIIGGALRINLKQQLRNPIRVSNSLDPESGTTFCGSWSGSKLFANVYQQLTKAATSKESYCVKHFALFRTDWINLFPAINKNCCLLSNLLLPIVQTIWTQKVSWQKEFSITPPQIICFNNRKHNAGQFFMIFCRLNFFHTIIRVSNSLNLDQCRIFFQPEWSSLN